MKALSKTLLYGLHLLLCNHIILGVKFPEAISLWLIWNDVCQRHPSQLLKILVIFEILTFQVLVIFFVCK
ncbi:hypothetical protein BHE74_00024125 [Ensete ventricosum]|nr:hypothetical protein GW17_00003503 [Ensete ventricosum]RWW68347.1 hypothetical protein BHE74_00024125 [Ensete ventricosum]